MWNAERRQAIRTIKEVESRVEALVMRGYMTKEMQERIQQELEPLRDQIQSKIDETGGLTWEQIF